jgi:putative nucleotidyltransferase with HDIG domain
LALLLSMAVEIETPFGYTAPTQIAFVPLLMAAPAALVGPIVLGVLLAARLPAIVRGESPAVRLLQVPANCWFAVGPAAVLAVAGTDPRHLGLAMLVAALGAQFAVDFAVSALRFSIAREASLSSQLRDAWVYLVDAGLSGVGWAVGLTQATRPLVGLAVIPLLALLFVLARERTKRLAATIELSNAYRGTALALGDVVAADDGYTGEHCRSVVVLAAAVGARLGLDSERARNLEFAALLHDVGKIAVPKEIVNKPGKLSPEEWTIIKTHTLEGQRMLDRVGGFMHEVGQIVRSHHERWDGAGYPDGLAGEAIPLEARIIACCDTWNAMRTDRSYRRALAYDVSLHELISNSGTQFDPRVVKTLVEIVREEEPTPSPRPAAEPDSAPAVLLP